MNQLIHTSAGQGTLVIAVTKQDVVAPDWPMSCGTYEFFGETKAAAAVWLDLKALQGPSGIAALYEQMANDVRSVTGWSPLSLTNNVGASASLA
jgi:hypothetical protein